MRIVRHALQLGLQHDFRITRTPGPQGVGRRKEIEVRRQLPEMFRTRGCSSRACARDAKFIRRRQPINLRRVA